MLVLGAANAARSVVMVIWQFRVEDRCVSVFVDFNDSGSVSFFGLSYSLKYCFIVIIIIPCADE